MTQIASLLTLTPVFVGLWTLIATFYGQRRRGAYMPDKNTYVQTFTKSAGGGAYAQGGGIFAGHYGIKDFVSVNYTTHIKKLPLRVYNHH